MNYIDSKNQKNYIFIQEGEEEEETFSFLDISHTYYIFSPSRDEIALFTSYLCEGTWLIQREKPSHRILMLSFSRKESHLLSEMADQQYIAESFSRRFGTHIIIRIDPVFELPILVSDPSIAADITCKNLFFTQSEKGFSSVSYCFDTSILGNYLPDEERWKCYLEFFERITLYGSTHTLFIPIDIFFDKTKKRVASIKYINRLLLLLQKPYFSLLWNGKSIKCSTVDFLGDFFLKVFIYALRETISYESALRILFNIKGFQEKEALISLDEVLFSIDVLIDGCHKLSMLALCNDEKKESMIDYISFFEKIIRAKEFSIQWKKDDFLHIIMSELTVLSDEFYKQLASISTQFRRLWDFKSL